MKENEVKDEFKVYKRRFAVLVTVVLLNISSEAMWQSYAPSATTAANYYETSPQRINWFSMVFMIVSMPFTFLSTYLIDRYGLKFGIYYGALTNCIGSVIRAIGSSELFSSKSVQYHITLFGQIVCATAQSFLIFIPTKVSQSWFPESQRALATTVLAMSNPLGVVVAQGMVPLIVDEKEENIPLNNYIWMAFAIFCLILTFICITSATPKTPPSLSAMKEEKERPPYIQQLRKVFTSLSYMLLLITLGCGVGVFNAIATLTQQILCPLGYTDVFSGLTNIVMILSGFVGSVITGIIADRKKIFEELTKITFGCGTISLVLLLEFYLVPNQRAAILVFAGLFGFFGLGAYPIGLELSVEVTYPVEETITTAFIFLSGEIHGILAIALIPYLASTTDSKSSLNVCNDEEIKSSKNYAVPLMIVMSYMSAVVAILIIVMKAKYKRLEAEKQRQKITDDQSSNLLSVNTNV